MTDEIVKPEDLKPGDEIEVTIRGRCAPPNFGDQKTVETIWFYPGTEKGFAVALRYLAHATITRLPPEAWKRFEGDFNAMTDAQIAHESRRSEDMIAECEDWLEAVAAWEAAGRPRKQEGV